MFKNLVPFQSAPKLKHHRFNPFMKPETQDMVQKTTTGIVGTASSWALQDVSTLGSIAVSVATFIYLAVQIAKLLRDWYLREKGIRSNIGEDN